LAEKFSFLNITARTHRSELRTQKFSAQSVVMKKAGEAGATA
jgi:hypothetical protein